MLGRIYESEYFDMGLLLKALEITWAKPIDMHCTFPCKGGMNLLMAAFASITHLHGENSRLNRMFSLSAV